jgi:acetyl esterase/lipase
MRRAVPPIPADKPGSASRRSTLAGALQARGVPVSLKLYPKLGHADIVAALSLPARGRAPTLAEIAAFVKQPWSS